MAKVLSVASSPEHRFSKQVQKTIRLIEGEGVEGDAHRGIKVQHLYHVRKGPTAPNLSQVHLFAAEMLAELARHGYPVAPGELGENVLTEGLDLLALPHDTILQLGARARVQITGLRTPCSQIDCFRAGLQAHLWGGRDSSGKRTRRAGVMSVVIEGGDVGPGDEISIYLPPGPHIPLEPV